MARSYGRSDPQGVIGIGTLHEGFAPVTAGELINEVHLNSEKVIGEGWVVIVFARGVAVGGCGSGQALNRPIDRKGTGVGAGHARDGFLPQKAGVFKTLIIAGMARSYGRSDPQRVIGIDTLHEEFAPVTVGELINEVHLNSEKMIGEGWVVIAFARGVAVVDVVADGH